MLRLSAFLLAVIGFLVSNYSSLSLACKCLPLPAEDAFCRTAFLALIQVKEISVNQTNLSRSYTYELLQDLTPLRSGKNLTESSRVMRSPLHSYNCAVFLDPDETYLVGGIFHNQKPSEPFLFSCHSYVEKWRHSGEESTRKLNGYIQQCQVFDKQNPKRD